MTRRTGALLVALIIFSALIPAAASQAAPSLTWTTCGACPETPDVTVSGNTITLGTPGVPEFSVQNTSVHGAAALLPPAASYEITLSVDLATWDSYNQLTGPGTGYWDSFSISVSSQPYWDLNLTDPITRAVLPGVEFVWGGTIYGDGVLETTGATVSFTASGNPRGTNYLNVVLDTASFPEANHAFPSWGTVTVLRVQPARLSTQGVTGDLYEAGTKYCATTYGKHKSPPGWGKPIDINAKNGDLNREVLAPAAGTVIQDRFDPGGGWGNAIIWTSADGAEELFVSHLNQVIKTGTVRGGEVIGLAGTTGTIADPKPAPEFGAHLHVSRTLNGNPAPLILSGILIKAKDAHSKVEGCYESQGPLR